MISLSAFEKITVYVNYSRDYLLEKIWWDEDDFNSSYHLDSIEYMNSFIYLTRTGSLWDHPIQYANFEFYVNKSLCSGNFNDGIEYREFLYQADQKNNYFRSNHDIASTSYYTEFLTTINNSYESYYHLVMKYYDWVPNKDVGVVWNTKHPVAKIETSFDVGMNPNIVFLNGNTSYDEGRIVNFTWKFDEIIISYNESIYFNLTGKGEYEIFLTVTDEMGYTGTTSKKVKMPSTQDYVFAGFTEKEIILYSFTGTLIVLFVGLVFVVVKRSRT